jgi:segregation and condensation protein B
LTDFNELELRSAIEAVLIVAEEPVSLERLAALLGVGDDVVSAQLASLRESYASAHGGVGAGFELREVGAGWRFYAREQHDPLLFQFFGAGGASRLSQPALETLAVIAYRQPIARGQIAAIRGVNVDGVVRTLQSRGLVDEVGAEPETGAVLFGTTQLFLEQLGLNDLSQLPPLSPLLPGTVEAED